MSTVYVVVVVDVVVASSATVLDRCDDDGGSGLATAAAILYLPRFLSASWSFSVMFSQGLSQTRRNKRYTDVISAD